MEKPQEFTDNTKEDEEEEEEEEEPIETDKELVNEVIIRHSYFFLNFFIIKTSKHLVNLQLNTDEMDKESMALWINVPRILAPLGNFPRNFFFTYLFL